MYEEPGLLPSALRKVSPKDGFFATPKRRRTYIQYNTISRIPEETSNDSGKRVRFNLSALGENSNQKYFSPKNLEPLQTG